MHFVCRGSLYIYIFLFWHWYHVFLSIANNTFIEDIIIPKFRMSKTIIHMSMSYWYIVFLLMFPLTCLEKTKMLYNDYQLHSFTFSCLSIFVFFLKIFPISFLIMFETTRCESKMDSCQIYNHIHIYLYEIIISDDLQSLELKSCIKKRLRYTLGALSSLRFSIHLVFLFFFLFFFFVFFFSLVIVSYHQAPYFEDWFQIASGFTKLFRSFSAWLKSIDKICQLEFKEINLLNILGYKLFISISIMIK